MILAASIKGKKKYFRISLKKLNENAILSHFLVISNMKYKTQTHSFIQKILYYGWLCKFFILMTAFPCVVIDTRQPFHALLHCQYARSPTKCLKLNL